ncbi:MAG: hypothetical protein R6U98_07320 [Pirellulaceae bacterium]
MNEELRKLMECYRPDRPLAGDTEFAALHQAMADHAELHRELEAVQAWDTTISRAMPQVPVPNGLEDRLLESVEAAEGELAHEGTLEATSPRSKRWWNRWPARITAGVISAAALVMIMFHVMKSRDTLSPTQAARAARGWIARLDEEGWQQGPPPGREYRHPALDFRLEDWQHFQAMGDPEAVAYRASVPPAWSRAVLFVVETRQGRLLPNQPPTVPDSTTRNICIGVWKSDEHLFALAVHGTQRTYRRVLKTHPIAALPVPQPVPQPTTWASSSACTGS